MWKCEPVLVLLSRVSRYLLTADNLELFECCFGCCALICFVPIILPIQVQSSLKLQVLSFHSTLRVPTMLCLQSSAKLPRMLWLIHPQHLKQSWLALPWTPNSIASSHFHQVLEAEEKPSRPQDWQWLWICLWVGYGIWKYLVSLNRHVVLFQLANPPPPRGLFIFLESRESRISRVVHRLFVKAAAHPEAAMFSSPAFAFQSQLRKLPALCIVPCCRDVQEAERKGLVQRSLTWRGRRCFLWNGHSFVVAVIHWKWNPELFVGSIVYGDPQHVFEMAGPRTMCLCYIRFWVWVFPPPAEVGFLLGSLHCSSFSCPWAATGGRSEHISREGWGPSKARNGIHHFALLEQLIFSGISQACSSTL